jgi:hypothetical protein
MHGPGFVKIVRVEVTLRLAVSQSLCQGVEPTLGLATRYSFLSEGCFLKFAVLSLWGALSDGVCHLCVAIHQYLHEGFIFLCFTVQQFICEASFSPGSVEEILLLYCLVRARDTWTVVQMTAAKLKPFRISCV